jgi:hypothetical protein
MIGERIIKMSGYENYTRVNAQTQVNKGGFRKGSQWAIYNATDVDTGVHKGVQQFPSHMHGYALFTCCIFVRREIIKLFFTSNEIYSEKDRHQCRNYCETWQLTNGNSICL